MLEESCGREAGPEPGCMRITDEGDQPGLKVHTQTYHAGLRRVAIECCRRVRRWAPRETLARVRSGTGTRHPTEGEKPAATGGREKREKPGQPSLASWDHDLVAIAHEAWQSGAVLVDMNPLG